MDKKECKHPHAIEDGYFECFFCELCGNYVDSTDVEFDTSGTFNNDDTCPTTLIVEGEERNGELLLGVYMTNTDFLEQTESCYMTLTEDQVIDLHNLLAKHIHNVNNRMIKKHNNENVKHYTKDDE